MPTQTYLDRICATLAPSRGEIAAHPRAMKLLCRYFAIPCLPRSWICTALSLLAASLSGHQKDRVQASGQPQRNHFASAYRAKPADISCCLCKLVTPPAFTNMSFAQAALAKLNNYRSMHGARPLTISSALTSYAQDWANRKQFKHSHGPYGENLAIGSGWGDDSTACIASVDMWYNEVSSYNFANPGFSSGTGHFTALVWAATTEVGFGVAVTANGSRLVVASFSPPGNVIGQFPQNVFPKRAAGGNPAGASVYTTIKAGDTFWALEEARGWQHGILQQLNPNTVPTNLQIGQRIRVPN